MNFSHCKMWPSPKAPIKDCRGRKSLFQPDCFFEKHRCVFFFELWVARRQVGVQARFVTEQGGYARHGVYDYFNTSFAFVPEVFLDKKQRLALSTGFYFDLAQQRSYRGDRASPSSNATFADPRQDIDRERGVLAGVSYRISFLEKWQPTMYVRHTFGLNDTRVRAISLGLSFQLGKK